MHPLLTILIATLCGALLALFLMAIALILLRILGVSILSAPRKRRKRRVKAGEATTAQDDNTDGALSEEELLVILTAAVTETLNDRDTGRFRVVSFRRI